MTIENVRTSLNIAWGEMGTRSLPEKNSIKKKKEKKNSSLFFPNPWEGVKLYLLHPNLFYVVTTTDVTVYNSQKFFKYYLLFILGVAYLQSYSAI